MALPFLGRLTDLPRVFAERDVDELIVAETDFDDRALLEIVELAHRRGVRVRAAPTTAELLTQRADYVPGQGVPLFELRPPTFVGTDWLVKRTFDLFVSVLVVLIGLPLWIAIAVAIKLGSRGPVFYRDRRVGLNEREFDMIKFRTMRAGASELQQRARGRERGRGGAVQGPRRPAGDAGGSISPPLLARRGAAGAERAPRGDEPRRAAAAAAARLQAARALAPQALPRPPGDDGPVADRRPLRPAASTTSSASTSTTWRTGRSGWTSRSCCGRSRPCSRRAARTSAGAASSTAVEYGQEELQDRTDSFRGRRPGGGDKPACNPSHDRRRMTACPAPLPRGRGENV